MTSGSSVSTSKVRTVMRAFVVCIAYAMLALTSAAAPQYTAVDLGAGRGFGGYATPTGGQQVGDDASQHAILWSGSAVSSQDLTPPGFVSSHGNGGYWTALGGRQVGSARGAVTGNNNHAFLWSG